MIFYFEFLILVPSVSSTATAWQNRKLTCDLTRQPSWPLISCGSEAALDHWLTLCKGSQCSETGKMKALWLRLESIKGKYKYLCPQININQ